MLPPWVLVNDAVEQSGELKKFTVQASFSDNWTAEAEVNSRMLPAIKVEAIILDIVRTVRETRNSLKGCAWREVFKLVDRYICGVIIPPSVECYELLCKLALCTEVT